MSIEHVEVIVIGAGWFGLAAAKTYLQVDPDVNLMVLDANPSLGGVWSQELLYDGLRTNNLLGTFEYPDFPMGDLGLDVKKGQYIPGHVILQYLKLYADKFDIRRRIKFNSKVTTIENLSTSKYLWRVTTELGAVLECEKLIVATGLTSRPSVPTFNDAQSFGAPIFHTKDFHRELPMLTKHAKSVTVLGGNKSAYDAVYILASAGIKVNWVIRKSGRGPGWMAPSYVTPLGIWIERLVTTRFLTLFSPCIWGDADGHTWARRFLHGTAVGRWIVDRFWGVMTDDVIQLNGYGKHPKTKELQPWYNSFWAGTNLSIFNYPTNVFDYVKDGTVQVHISDIARLSPGTVHLSDGVALVSDALVLCTGWHCTPSIKFLPEGIEKDLGLPHKSDVPDPTLEAADKEILRKFPRLATPPAVLENFHAKTEAATTTTHRPFRLHRFMAPPINKFGQSITFNGAYLSINGALAAEIQALWSVAYFQGKIPVYNGDEEDLVWKTTLATRFGRWRCPGGAGNSVPDIIFDSLPYFDTLLQDLELPSQRKNGWFANLFVPYRADDYRGLTAEWVAKVKSNSPELRIY